MHNIFPVIKTFFKKTGKMSITISSLYLRKRDIKKLQNKTLQGRFIPEFRNYLFYT